MDELDIMEFPIERAVGYVHIDLRRMQRDIRRNGKTSQAAARLAMYRLRRFMRSEGCSPVDDIELHVSDDFMFDARHVAATVRMIRSPFPIADFRIPPEMHVVRLPVPRLQA